MKTQNKFGALMKITVYKWLKIKHAIIVQADEDLMSTWKKQLNETVTLLYINVLIRVPL